MEDRPMGRLNEREHPFFTSANTTKDPASSTDVTVENHGTLWRFELHTPVAREWAKDNVQIEDYMRFGTFGGDDGGFHCEHRYAPGIVDGMLDAGLTVAPHPA